MRFPVLKADLQYLYDGYQSEEKSKDRSKIDELEEPKQKFVDDFIPEYLAYSQTNKSIRTVEIDASALEKFKRLQGNIPLDSITPQMIEGFKAELLKSKSQEYAHL